LHIDSRLGLKSSINESHVEVFKISPFAFIS